MRLLGAETPRVAPVLLVSLLLHLVALYGASRLQLRENCQAQKAPEAVDAYLEPGDPGQGRGALTTAPKAVPAPVAPLQPASASPVASPVASPRPTAHAPFAEVPRPAPAAGASAHTIAPVPGTVASPRVTTSRDGGGVRPTGGGAEITGREAADSGTTALPKGAGAGPAAASSPGKAGAHRELRGNYQAQLKRLVEAHKEYPLAARKSGREGSCRRRFVLRRDGSLQQVESVNSCGHPFLDAAATRAISSVGAFPPVPAELSPEEPFEVTITFALASR